MSSYRDFLQETRQQIDEIDAEHARERHDGADPAVFLDVREREEWDEGHIPGAVHLPRGWLESRIESAVPDRAKPIVAACGTISRSSPVRAAFQTPATPGVLKWREEGASDKLRETRHEK